jgi:hypothetical protein
MIVGSTALLASFFSVFLFCFHDLGSSGYLIYKAMDDFVSRFEDSISVSLVLASVVLFQDK